MYYAGVDVGAATGKVVILGEEGEMVGFSIVPTGASSRRAAEVALEKALEKAGLDRDLVGPMVATGYGRASVDYAEKQVTEITCHARGAYHLYPQARTVIDIGGQDSKVILIGPKGRVLDFLMNDKCAAGTGRFLEVMARALELDIEELGEVGLRARRPVSISSTCTVFAESEVVGLVAEGVSREDIVAGLHKAIARRIGAMAARVGFVPPVIMAGGVAKNRGAVKALEEELGVPLIVPEEPQIVGALGAALLAREAGSR